MSTKKDSLLNVKDVEEVRVVSFGRRRIENDEEIEVVGHDLLNMVANGRHRMIINFADLDWFAKYLLGSLFRLDAKIRKAGGLLVLCAVNEIMLEYRFGLRGLVKFFTFAVDESAALKLFERSVPP